MKNRGIYLDVFVHEIVTICMFVTLLYSGSVFLFTGRRRARPRKDAQYSKRALFILEDASIHGHDLEHLELFYLTVILAKIHRYMSKTPCGTAQLSYKTRIKLSIRSTKHLLYAVQRTSYNGNRLYRSSSSWLTLLYCALELSPSPAPLALCTMVEIQPPSPSRLLVEEPCRES
jgi:hypothetical protein